MTIYLKDLLQEETALNSRWQNIENFLIFEPLSGLACILAFALTTVSKAPYQLKMAVYSIGSGCIVLVSLPFMIFRPKDYRNALAPAWGCRLLARALGVTMEVRGLENIDKTHGSVVLINHQSIFDLTVLAYLWPIIGRATVVSKKEVLYLPIFGFGAWLWGTLFIDRANQRDTINSLNKESEAIMYRCCKLLLFPEGTRNPTRTLLPFKKGAFHIAVQTGCPIQPVVVSHYSFLNSEKKHFRKGHAIIQILPEIDTTGYTTDNIDIIMEKAREIMQNEYKLLSDEAIILNTNKYY